MTKVIAEVFKLHSGMPFADLYALNEDGSPDLALTQTMLCLVSEMDLRMAENVSSLLDSFAAGTYVPEFPDFADWGLNDKNVWLRGSNVPTGHVLISNENVEEFSEEYGSPQLFSIETFRAIISFWVGYISHLKVDGIEAHVGTKTIVPVSYPKCTY